MPWKCPACQEAIQHRADEDHPRVGVHYRCPICHLTLELDPVTGQLIALDEEEDRREAHARAARGGDRSYCC
jgi:hypothetical protein